jgi:hypothetical protein
VIKITWDGNLGDKRGSIYWRFVGINSALQSAIGKLFNSTKTFLYVEPQSLEQKRSNKENKVNSI